MSSAVLRQRDGHSSRSSSIGGRRSVRSVIAPAAPAARGREQEQAAQVAPRHGEDVRRRVEDAGEDLDQQPGDRRRQHRAEQRGHRRSRTAPRSRRTRRAAGAGAPSAASDREGAAALCEPERRARDRRPRAPARARSQLDPRQPRQLHGGQVGADDAAAAPMMSVTCAVSAERRRRRAATVRGLVRRSARGRSRPHRCRWPWRRSRRWRRRTSPSGAVGNSFATPDVVERDRHEALACARPGDAAAARSPGCSWKSLTVSADDEHAVRAARRACASARRRCRREPGVLQLARRRRSCRGRTP